MNKFLPVFAAFLLFTAARAQQTDIPAELKQFVKPGYEVLDFAKADLNNDKLGDYILILKKTGEDSLPAENEEWEIPRPLLLITRKPGNKLSMAVENDELVLCKRCGGVFGDPYEGMLAKPGGFTINFYGGSSWRWAEEYSFVYDATKKNWFLQKHRSSYFQSGDPENTMKEAIIKRAETGDIGLQNFSLYYNADSSMYKVNVAKTYFYDSPDLKSKPRKGYLVKGDEVVSTQYFKNFIRCTFTNKKEEYTYGYILKKDLVLIKAQKPAHVQ